MAAYGIHFFKMCIQGCELGISNLVVQCNSLVLCSWIKNYAAISHSLFSLCISALPLFQVPPVRPPHEAARRPRPPHQPHPRRPQEGGRRRGGCGGAAAAAGGGVTRAVKGGGFVLQRGAKSMIYSSCILLGIDIRAKLRQALRSYVFKLLFSQILSSLPPWHCHGKVI